MFYLFLLLVLNHYIYFVTDKTGKFTIILLSHIVIVGERMLCTMSVHDTLSKCIQFVNSEKSMVVTMLNAACKTRHYDDLETKTSNTLNTSI